jgi:recombination protein U
MTRRGAETGSGFQEAINRTNEAYKKLGRAVITRKAVPGKFILERDHTRRGLALPTIELPADNAQARLSSASLKSAVREHKLSDWRAFIPESKGEPDYGGALGPDGRAIFFDAKTTRRDALDFDNLHAHQVIFLEHMARVGAVAGFLVEFSKYRRVFFLPIQVLTIWRTESTRKSLPFHFFSEYLTPVPVGKGLLIYDYLTAIEEQERHYSRDFIRFTLAATPARARRERKLAAG